MCAAARHAQPAVTLVLRNSEGWEIKPAEICWDRHCCIDGGFVLRWLLNTRCMWLAWSRNLMQKSMEMGIKINDVGNWNGNGTYVSMSRERLPALPPPVFHPQHTIVVKFKEFKVQKFKEVQKCYYARRNLNESSSTVSRNFRVVRRRQCLELTRRDLR